MKLERGLESCGQETLTCVMGPTGGPATVNTHFMTRNSSIMIKIKINLVGTRSVLFTCFHSSTPCRHHLASGSMHSRGDTAIRE